METYGYGTKILQFKYTAPHKSFELKLMKLNLINNT